MTGTVTVTVHRNAMHTKYRKSYRISKKYLVDTGEHQNLREGDEVMIGECKPISKKKHFMIVEILKRAANVSELREEAGLEGALHREKTQSEASEASEESKTSEENSQEKSL
jgi:small subunit ribosomal protein S17